MSTTSTPLQSNSKKRVLSSPEDVGEVKKNKSDGSQENQDSAQLSGSYLDQPEHSDTSEISDLSVMASMTSEGGSTPATANVTLKESDLKTIANVLKEAFDPKLTEMVNSIVTGVIEGLQLQIKKLQKENKDLLERVAKLEIRADVAEQYSRRNCLRIAGVPENEAEDTDTYMIDLSKAIGADVTLDDIERSHRVGKPPSTVSFSERVNRPRDIIVKFASYRIRRKVYAARTNTKTSGYNGVYINEDLTKPRNKLLLKARKMAKANRLKSAWSSDGNILVRDLRDMKHRILSECDLAVFGSVPKLRGETESSREAPGSAGEGPAPMD